MSALELRVTDGTSSRSHSSNAARLRIGRGPGCEIRLLHRSISRRHCELAWHDGTLWAVPGRNAHTWLDGIALDRRRPARAGSTLTCGAIEVHVMAVRSRGPIQVLDQAADDAEEPDFVPGERVPPATAEAARRGVSFRVNDPGAPTRHEPVLDEQALKQWLRAYWYRLVLAVLAVGLALMALRPDPPMSSLVAPPPCNAPAQAPAERVECTEPPSCVAEARERISKAGALLNRPLASDKRQALIELSSAATAAERAGPMWTGDMQAAADAMSARAQEAMTAECQTMLVSYNVALANGEATAAKAYLNAFINIFPEPDDPRNRWAIRQRSDQ